MINDNFSRLISSNIDDGLEIGDNFFNQVKNFVTVMFLIKFFVIIVLIIFLYIFTHQLDSMIAAVKNESLNLESLNEKLKEADDLKIQVSDFNKQLLEADQTNLNLKSDILKLQYTNNNIKKSKEEVNI
jgi:hypothetical protein